MSAPITALRRATSRARVTVEVTGLVLLGLACWPMPWERRPARPGLHGLVLDELDAAARRRAHQPRGRGRRAVPATDRELTLHPEVERFLRAGRDAVLAEPMPEMFDAELDDLLRRAGWPVDGDESTAR